jgi:hypothetical protein
LDGMSVWFGSRMSETGAYWTRTRRRTPLSRAPELSTSTGTLNHAPEVQHPERGEEERIDRYMDAGDEGL